MTKEKIVVEYVRVQKTGNPNEDKKTVTFEALKEATAWVESLKRLDQDRTFTNFQIYR